MILSQSSRTFDPLSDVLTVLDARATRRTRFEGSGDWALAFPALERLKFVAVLRGAGWLLLPDTAPQRIEAGDCCLIGRTAYVIASDPTLVPIDGSGLYAEGNDLVCVGGDETVTLGGGISFTPGNASFLLDMLPAFMHVSGRSMGAAAITAGFGVFDGGAAGPAHRPGAVPLPGPTGGFFSPPGGRGRGGGPQRAEDPITPQASPPSPP